MKPEQKLWQLVKNHLPGTPERVENVAGAGMPDVYGYSEGFDYWLELKVQSENTEVEDASPLTLLRPSQRIWHMKYATTGRGVFILVRNGQRLTLHLSSGTSAVTMWRGTKPWDWAKLRHIMGDKA